MNKEEIIKLAKNIIKICLVLLWMIIIYRFSNEVGETSTSTSGNTIRSIIELISPNIEANKLERYVDYLQPLARKSAHFCLYAIGGGLIYYAILKIKFLNIRYKYIVTQVIGSIYACSDEIHQSYVPGRSCELRDWIIDSLGILFGFIVSSIIIKFIEKIKSSRKKL